VAAAKPADGVLVTLAGGAGLAFGKNFRTPITAPSGLLSELAAKPDDLTELRDVVDCKLYGWW
jgi:hypothetical protein